MSLSASFFGDCCLPDISSSSRVAEICAGSLTTELAVAAERERRGGRARARLTGAGEAALMTMVAAAVGTEEAEGVPPPVDAAGSKRGEVATARDWPFPIPGKWKYKLTH